MSVKGRIPIHNRKAKTPAPDSGAENSCSDDEDYKYCAESAMSTTPPSPEQSIQRKKQEKILESNTVQKESTEKQWHNQTSSTGNDSNLGKVASILLGLVLTYVVVIFVIPYMSSTVSAKKYCSYDELRRQHPEQREFVWRSLSTGIENIINKRTDSPGVYLFVHEGGGDGLKLVRDIAVQSSTCFGKSMQPLEMKNDDFTSMSAIKDYGYAIEKYKMKIKKGRVVVIANLNEIPAEAARALHTICDTHSPIKKEVIIFLTLAVPKIGETPLKNVKDTLIDLWGSKLDIDELEPLITRVTDQVIALES